MRPKWMKSAQLQPLVLHTRKKQVIPEYKRYTVIEELRLDYQLRQVYDRFSVLQNSYSKANLTLPALSQMLQQAGLALQDLSTDYRTVLNNQLHLTFELFKQLLARRVRHEYEYGHPELAYLRVVERIVCNQGYLCNYRSRMLSGFEKQTRTYRQIIQTRKKTGRGQACRSIRSVSS